MNTTSTNWDTHQICQGPKDFYNMKIVRKDINKSITQDNPLTDPETCDLLFCFTNCEITIAFLSLLSDPEGIDLLSLTT